MPEAQLSRSHVPVLTIDGPSGSGKGTISRAVARSLGWHFLDSGVLYRVVGWAALKRDIALDDESALAELSGHIDLVFRDEGADEPVILVDGERVGAQLRTEATGDAASRIAALPAVRAALLDKQRNCRTAPGLVADGRDMGTVVFPDAGHKVFLTASVEERADRRHKQLKAKGVDANILALSQEIRLRDQRDRERPVAPLKPADDAVIIDTTGVGIDEVVRQVLGLVAV
jgi:cytidylate kinase